MPTTPQFLQREREITGFHQRLPQVEIPLGASIDITDPRIARDMRFFSPSFNRRVVEFKSSSGCASLTTSIHGVSFGQPTGMTKIQA